MDRYGSDILAHDPHEHGSFARYGHSRPCPANYGEVFEEVETGWCGAVTKVEKSGGMQVVVLTDRHGRSRTFELGPGFLFEGEPVILTPPQRAPKQSAPTNAAGKIRTNSGSVAVKQTRAKVAQASRIWVEGRHDAELVEHVWGDDLRVEGVVVELLDGADHLEAILADFAPTSQRRAGVLLDHLIPGSKEDRIAKEIRTQHPSDSLLIVGHPYIDIWQAVKPARLGFTAWPEVPRGTDFKYGTLAALGWPANDYSDVASAWQRILRSVRDFRDLEPAFLGRVEELIDFVTVGHS
ncbi:hypothetical protein BK816_06100 [Boudabousia tangfeifanii]|uniref:DUF3097 domain-containing protein n=1 Tax=Boudabousia tangfeifanii TaxID=1912795 RepID=A0A1D9MKW0_9ACTO|nr:DUF3097 domain-containing protein [Boudabousia tangfeifanii]AOZ72916.1 hypothetical protein BK816_06100 [Boudabousia tangfeifanii]